MYLLYAILKNSTKTKGFKVLSLSSYRGRTACLSPLMPTAHLDKLTAINKLIITLQHDQRRDRSNEIIMQARDITPGREANMAQFHMKLPHNTGA